MESSFAPLTAALECMSRIASCTIVRLEAAELRPLLCFLPNLTHLNLKFPEDVHDSNLQKLWQCPQLRALEVSFCDEGSAMDVYVLCKSLLRLVLIRFHCCDQLTRPALADCRALLVRQGSMVKTTCEGQQPGRGHLSNASPWSQLKTLQVSAGLT